MIKLLVILKPGTILSISLKLDIFQKNLRFSKNLCFSKNLRVNPAEG
jgi:hypothetical protein